MRRAARGAGRSEGGYSLVELMVAALLLAILSLAVFTYHSFNYWAELRAKSKCLLVTQDKLDELKVTPYAALASGAATIDGCQMQWGVAASATPAFKTLILITSYDKSPNQIRLATIVAPPL